MKKTLLFLFAILFSMTTMAQNRAMLLSESFDGSSMPAGWNIEGLGQSNWSISSSQHAGGTPNELMLYYNPSFNGTSRFVSPAIDLTGKTSFVITFKHALDNYSGGHTLGVATSSDGGSTWNSGWSQTYNTSSSWVVSQQITTADVGNDNVKVCIYYTGNSYNINNWYFDDIDIFTLENLDANLTAINVPGFFGQGSTAIGFNVANYGDTPITSIEATYQITGMEPVTETFDLNLSSLANTDLQFSTPAVLAPGSYDITISIDKVNGGDDDDLSNNTASKTVSVALSSIQKIPMIEHFSSSTCGPCVSVNTQMLNFCNNNVGRFTYTKYQMNWPGNGDPYYTAEGGVRRTYYGVSAVPQCFLDGDDQGYAAVTQNVFDQHASEPAFMDIRGSFTVDGNTIHVLVDVMPYIDITANVFVSVNEKETHNNVGGNGETSFHHIFMKMLTNTTGNACDFVSGEVQQFEFTQDMSSTHVEEMSDLEVSIWVQNYSTHEVLNSHFSYEYTDEHPYMVENLNLVELVSDGDVTLQATWNAAENANPIGYDVYVNGEIAAEGIAVTEYTFTGDSNLFYTVEVVALYADGKSSVKAVAALDNVAVVCDPVTDLTAEPYVYNGDNGALVSWTEPEGATSYQIFVDDELLGATDGQPIFINFEGDPAGIYTIGIVAVYDDCQSDMATVDFEWTDPASVGEVELVTTVYPNPTTGNFTIEGADIAKVTIYNLVGQKVFEQQGDKVINIDASDWTKGMYLISITNGQGAVETRKLMVE